MVNPYLTNTNTKPQLLLGQSQASKKFEKFQNKYTSGFNAGAKKKNDSDDDDSLIKNIKESSKKFIKKKPEPQKQDNSDSDSLKEQSLTESKQSDLSIDYDRSSTPVPAKRQSLTKPQHVTHIPYSHRSSSRIRSAASSVSSIRSLNKRSVKFQKTDSNQDSENSEDESTEIEEMLSKNLILDINDLTYQGHSSGKERKFSKSPLGITAQKRSESVTSIREDDEYLKKNDSSESDKSLSKANNLIMDINDLEKSLSKVEENKKKSSKKEKEKRVSNNKKKSNKKLDDSNSTIKTESITENDTLIEDQLKSQSSEANNQSRRGGKEKRKKRLASYASDFDEITSFTQKSTRRQPSLQMKNAETQVDATDLLKNGNIFNSINCYNPTSMLLATTTYLSNDSTLKDLNQITGYSMINQAFNDLIKMNVAFLNNFLITQRNLYQDQLKSIQPRERKIKEF